MDRRYFLKLTGFTLIPIFSFPSFAGKEETPKWIKLSEQQPKIGQKIVLLTYNIYDYKTPEKIKWIYIGTRTNQMLSSPSLEPVKNTDDFCNENMVFDLETSYKENQRLNYSYFTFYIDKEEFDNRLNNEIKPQNIKYPNYVSKYERFDVYHSLKPQYVFFENKTENKNMWWLPYSKNTIENLPTYPISIINT